MDLTKSCKPKNRGVTLVSLYFLSTHKSDTTLEMIALVDIRIVSLISLSLSGIYYSLNGRTLKSMYNNFWGRV